MTTATRRVLQEEGAEAALTDLASKVDDAEAAMKLLLEKDKTRTWTIRLLQDDANTGGWSSSVMSLAFLRLLKKHLLEVDSNLQVHAL
jgi:hypothetical protein